MGLVTVCRARDAGAEVTIAGRSPDKLFQAQQELGPVHTVVMDMTDEDAVEKVSEASVTSTTGASRPGRFATAR